MSALTLSQWQFAVATTYHFLFVAVTLGLSILVAYMELLYIRTEDELYKKMTQFWGKLFLVNFAMGVVTGIAQEFHFGMNWSEYSRFMGDIFGAPLALEALSAFFLESVFLGIWIFGWDRLSKKLHAAAIVLVAFAANLSAFWILTANSFMQAPVGYVLRNGRAEMTDFRAMVTNDYLVHQYPHVLTAGLVTAAFLVTAISAYHLLQKSHLDFFRRSFRIGVSCALFFAILSTLTGHFQAQYIAKAQPMKLAAAEALWESANPAYFTVIAAIDESNQKNTFEVVIPGALSFLVYNSFQGQISGMKEIQKKYEKEHGPANYIPPVKPVFWSFRVMVVAGGWLIIISLLGLYLNYKGKLESNNLALTALMWTGPVPFIANSTGWFMTEIGRQPWIVFGLQRVEQGVSPNLTVNDVWITLIIFTIVYAFLAGAAIYLWRLIIMQGPCSFSYFF